MTPPAHDRMQGILIKTNARREGSFRAYERAVEVTVIAPTTSAKSHFGRFYAIVCAVIGVLLTLLVQWLSGHWQTNG